MKILSGDIGGTNARFANFEWSVPDGLRLVQMEWLSTDDYDSFESLLDGLSGTGFSLAIESADRVVIGVAGAVEDNSRARLPNVGWDVDVENLYRSKVLIINDFAAQAVACLTPLGSTMRILRSGNTWGKGVVGVVGAGTGLGKCALIPNSNGGTALVPSEGGHAGFPFSPEKIEREYSDYLIRELGGGEISNEHVLCGAGLTRLFDFLGGGKHQPEQVAAEMGRGTELGELAKTLYTRFYARVCRNYALEIMATGGLGIAGGIGARNPEIVASPLFEQEFNSHPVHRSLLSKIELRLMTNQNAGLWGAAWYGAGLDAIK